MSATSARGAVPVAPSDAVLFVVDATVGATDTDASVVRVLRRGEPERLEHPFGRVEGDHLPDSERERQRVAARPGADVEPGLTGPGQLEEGVERRVVGA